LIINATKQQENSMSSGQITGGVVSFEERRKIGDFEHRAVKVDLNFSVEDGVDHRDIFDQVAEEARNKVLHLHGLKPVAGKKPPHVGQTVSQEKAMSAPPNVNLPVEKTETVVNEPAPGAVAEPAKDPAAMEDDSPLAETPSNGALKTGEPATAADPADMGSIEADEITAGREYTDKDLSDAITTVNARLINVHKEKGTLKIRELLAKFVLPGKPARSIPADKREQFIKELEALK
jgi:hypothetical protein